MIDNSKPFSRIFSFKGRATRLEFNVITTAIVLVWGILLYLLMETPVGNSMTGMGDSFLYILLIAIVLTLYIGMAVTFRRRHDLDMKGMESDSGFGFECMFKKGVPYFNVYGSDPLQDYEPQLEQLNKLIAEQQAAASEAK